MNIVIIPGFLGHPEEVTFKELSEALQAKNHTVTIIAWPHLPDDLKRYSFSETIAHARKVIDELPKKDLIILGFSMGCVVATLLASECKPKKLGLIVAPYQAGSDDDLASKYKDWQETGYRDVTSSRYGKLRVPFSFIEDAQKYNALSYMQDIDCPVLFIAGEEDDKVPLATTKKLFEKTSNPKEWHQLKAMQHKYQYQPAILQEVNKIIVEFID